MESIWHLTVDGKPAAPGPEGFVHCSFTGQLDGTLALHFREARSVRLLRLDPSRLDGRLRLESSRGGARFPHVYGEIEAEDVLENHVIERGEDGCFDLSLLGRDGKPTENAP
ncbi:MAG: DUF952 domain-containing protein [Planctomycetota bacterium]